MLNNILTVILILLLIFTPLAFGSMELWAFSLMELAIFLIAVLSTLNWVLRKPRGEEEAKVRFFDNPWGWPALFIALFIVFVLFQTLPIPAGLLKILSPRTHALRLQLCTLNLAPENPPVSFSFPISFVPFATRIEFLKWFALAIFFFLLLSWRGFERAKWKLIPVVLFVGMAESLYGIIEFFTGHKHILHLDASHMMSAVTGTFINRNYLAGYLLMAIPLTIGYTLYRESLRPLPSGRWYRLVSSLDGKTYFIAFGTILMLLALFLSASRMGILSGLLSFTIVAWAFRNTKKGQKISKPPLFILCLALLWAAWIGLDAVISRFFSIPESLKNRWEIWADTFRIIKDFPLFGSGLGTFTQVFPAYRSFHIEGLVTHAENDLLQLVSEVGLLGAGLLLAALMFLLRRVFSGIRALPQEDPTRYIAVGGLVGIFALLFHSLVERNIQVMANSFLFTFILALILRISMKKGEFARRRSMMKPNEWR